MSSVDLFGAEPEPPRKGAEGYLAHLAGLAYPERLTFWALADGPTRVGPDHEWVWLTVPGGQWRRHMVDIRTGAVVS